MEIEFEIGSKDGRRHVAKQLKSMSREELELTALRAIDHAAHNDAQLLEFASRLEGAFGAVEKFRSAVKRLDPEAPELDHD